MKWLGGCHALGSVISTVSDHERQGWEGVTRGWSPIMSAVGWVARGCHALGFVVSHGEHNGAGRVSRGSGPW